MFNPRLTPPVLYCQRHTVSILLILAMRLHYAPTLNALGLLFQTKTCTPKARHFKPAVPEPDETVCASSGQTCLAKTNKDAACKN